MSMSCNVKITYKGGAIPPHLMKQAHQKAFLAGQRVRTHILEQMAKPKTGRWYIVPGTRVKYQASAPGEYPAIRTGQLRSSIRVADIVGANFVRVLVGTYTRHGARLELGLRPWLRRAFYEMKGEIQKIMGSDWSVD